MVSACVSTTTASWWNCMSCVAAVGFCEAHAAQRSNVAIDVRMADTFAEFGGQGNGACGVVWLISRRERATAQPAIGGRGTGTAGGARAGRKGRTRGCEGGGEGGHR